MKKKIFSVALLAMSLFAVNSIAQTPSTGSDTQIENVKGKKCDKKCEKADKDGKKADKKEKRAKMNPYEGLKLTDAQKTKLQQLDEKRLAQHKQNKEAEKAENQRNDSLKMEARKTAKKEYLNEVKAIIGPDQYVVFLENFYINGGNHVNKQMKQGQRGGKNFAQGKDMKGKKGDARKKGNKGDRNKQGKNAKANAQATATAQI